MYVSGMASKNRKISSTPRMGEVDLSTGLAARTRSVAGWLARTGVDSRSLGEERKPYSVRTKGRRPGVNHVRHRHHSALMAHFLQ